jgi:hypothetical protein
MKANTIMRVLFFSFLLIVSVPQRVYSQGLAEYALLLSLLGCPNVILADSVTINESTNDGMGNFVTKGTYESLRNKSPASAEEVFTTSGNFEYKATLSDAALIGVKSTECYVEGNGTSNTTADQVHMIVEYKLKERNNLGDYPLIDYSLKAELKYAVGTREDVSMNVHTFFGPGGIYSVPKPLLVFIPAEPTP